MKKIIKIAVVSVIGLLSTTVAAAQLSADNSSNFVKSWCDKAPLLCSLSTSSNGNGDEMPRPGDKKK